MPGFWAAVGWLLGEWWRCLPRAASVQLTLLPLVLGLLLLHRWPWLFCLALLLPLLLAWLLEWRPPGRDPPPPPAARRPARRRPRARSRARRL